MYKSECFLCAKDCVKGLHASRLAHPPGNPMRAGTVITLILEMKKQVLRDYITCPREWWRWISRHTLTCSSRSRNVEEGDSRG